MLRSVLLCARAMPAGTTSFYLVRMSRQLIDELAALDDNEKLPHADRGFVCEWCEHVADIAARDSEIATLVGLLREVLDSDSDAVKETELGDRIRAALENNRGGK